MTGYEQADKVLQRERPGLAEKVDVVFARDGRWCKRPVSWQAARKAVCELQLIEKILGVV